MSSWLLRSLAGLFVCGACLASAFAEEEGRQPLPAPAAIAKAEATVREIFKVEYAKSKPAERAALATQLLNQAKESSDDPASKFVLLREARDVAAKAGDGATAFRAASNLSDEFQISAGESIAAMADSLSIATIGAIPSRQVADALFAAGSTAKSDGDIKASIAILKAADVAARKGQSVPLSNAIRARLREAEALKAEVDAVDRHVATLEKTPGDPAANLAVGRYLCGIRHDWKGGLPLLAKGGDAKLKEIAAKDQAATAGTAAEQLTAADAWYDYAAAADATFQVTAKSRAYHWYQAAQPTAAGLSKVKIEARLKELQSVAQEQGGGAARFALVRRALADNQLKRWQIVGGAFAREAFEELPPEPSILIGFNYTTVQNGSYPGVIQAIYLTARGEVKGKIFGTPEPGAMGQTTKAKPGYAIGAIYTRGGGGFDALKPIYMRMTENGLDPTDSYEGPHIGGRGGGEGTLGADGQYIVGIHGKVNDKGKMEAISAITIAAPNAPVPDPNSRPMKKTKNRPPIKKN